MADPLTLILLVFAGEAADPVTQGIAAAARSALGPDGRVVVHGWAGPPSDQRALDVEANEHADGIAELRWSQPHHREAALRMHVAGTNAWIDRRIDFRRSDADAERERTLAFAMVSIFPEAVGSGPPIAGDDADGGAANDADGDSGAHGAQSATDDDDAEAPAGARTPDGPDGGRSSPADANPSARETSGSAIPDTARTGTPAVASTMGLEVLVVDAAGDDEGAGEIGGALAFTWFFWRNMSLRVGGSVRDTSLDEASGDLLKVTASAGLAFHPWRTTRERPFGASLRLDYLFLYERLSRIVPPGQNVPINDGVLSGFDATLDGSWLFAPSVEVILGAGVEAFPPTKIEQGTTTIASLPIARAIFEGGLRLRF